MRFRSADMLALNDPDDLPSEDNWEQGLRAWERLTWPGIDETAREMRAELRGHVVILRIVLEAGAGAAACAPNRRRRVRARA